MNERSRLTLSTYHYEKALRCVMTAKLLLDEDTDTSANRSYYAVLNAILSVTSLDGFEADSDSEVISYFNQHYVKTGIFIGDISVMIANASKLREHADYKDFYITPYDNAQKQVNSAEQVIHMVRPYLESRWAKLKQQIPSAIFTRTSTRQFETRPVESKYIIKILRAAMAAPSACWEFYITDDKDIISRLSQVSPYAGPVKNAPVVIVPCYHTDNLAAPMMAEIDMSLATQNILLEAEELGLGAVMIGIAPIPERMQAVSEILKLPENFKAFTIIPVGWPVNKRPQEDRYEPSRIHTL